MNLQAPCSLAIFFNKWTTQLLDLHIAKREKTQDLRQSLVEENKEKHSLLRQYTFHYKMLQELQMSLTVQLTNCFGSV